MVGCRTHTTLVQAGKPQEQSTKGVEGSASAGVDTGSIPVGSTIFSLGIAGVKNTKNPVTGNFILDPDWKPGARFITNWQE